MGEGFNSVFSDGERLVIAGSGNVALHIYKFAQILGYKVTVIDNRAETLTRERFPEASELLLGDIVELLNDYSINETTSIVLVSYQHEFDEAALQVVIRSPARYIGVLGNKRKVTAYFSKLNVPDISEEHMDKVHMPVGLDLGGQRAAEIALAVMAEIQAVKYGRPGGFLTIKQVNRRLEVHEELF
jgi:xanthine dehydrogenase accessory factor